MGLRSLITLIILLSLIGLFLASKGELKKYTNFFKAKVGQFISLLSKQKPEEKVFQITMKADKSILPNHKFSLKSSETSGKIVYEKINIDGNDYSFKENRIEFYLASFSGNAYIDNANILSLEGNSFNIQINDFYISPSENKTLSISVSGIPYEFSITNINQDLSFSGVRGELKIDDKTSINLDNDAVKLGNFKGSLVQNSDDSVILSGTATSIDINGEDVTINIK
jgi:hypothetical protein